MNQVQLARYVAGLLQSLDAVQIDYNDRADIIMQKLIDLGVQLPNNTSDSSVTKNS